MAFTLPALNYSYEALDPHIDSRTMEIHHTKHHQGYITKLNAAIEGTSLDSQSIEDILSHLDTVPQDKKGAIRNNGGGHANHSLFWKVIAPHKGAGVTGDLANAIDSTFGSFDAFKDQFSAAAATRFGSGWAWLSIQNGQLVVSSTPNQDSPLMDGHSPILGLDVWEHAYYLNYQNRRPDYIAAFWNIVNWDQVSQNFQLAQTAKTLNSIS
jgi:Fe-Mn family superoxide dismutase